MDPNSVSISWVCSTSPALIQTTDLPWKSCAPAQDVSLAKNARKDARRAPRVLFKHKGQLDFETFPDAFLKAMSNRDRVLHRRVLQDGGAAGLRIESLGSNTAYNMIEVPAGLSVEAILKALQDHPGMHLLTTMANRDRFCKHRPVTAASKGQTAGEMFLLSIVIDRRRCCIPVFQGLNMSMPRLSGNVQ